MRCNHCASLRAKLDQRQTKFDQMAKELKTLRAQLTALREQLRVAQGDTRWIDEYPNA